MVNAVVAVILVEVVAAVVRHGGSQSVVSLINYQISQEKKTETE